MREILFRGKCVSDGHWVHGLLISIGGELSMLTSNNGLDRAYPVLSETVGQYIGLTDKNGEKIYEGDVLKGKFSNYVIRFDEEERAFVYGSSRKGGYIHSLAKYLIGDYKNLRVIGNIHDNPELITCGANSEK